MRQLDAVGEIRKPPGCDISVFMLSYEDTFGDPIRVAVVVPFQRMVTSMLEWPQDRASVRHLFIFFQGGGGGRQDLIYNV